MVKGSKQRPHPPDSSALMVTTATFATRDGDPIDGVGVEPTSGHPKGCVCAGGGGGTLSLVSTPPAGGIVFFS